MRAKSCLWFLFDDLDDWEVNHCMVAIKLDFSPSVDRDSSIFQLVGVNPVMYFVHL